MSLTGLGRTGFEDRHIPAPGKSEFGMDTLIRELQGFVGENGELLKAFLATLGQGDTYTIGENIFYLQSWQPNNATPIGSVTLNYKGLRDGGTPIPDVQTDIVSASGRITRSYLDENGGFGRIFRNRAGGSINTTVSGAVVSQLVLSSPVYTVSATCEFLYHAVESRYRYISEGQPDEPENTEVQSSYVPEIEEARISTSDGMVYPRSNLVAFDMEVEPRTRVVSWSAKNVLGSPYFEVEEIVRLELVDPEEFED